VGKTCFLEALYLYAHRGHPVILGEILQARDELWDVSNNYVEATLNPHAVQLLFYGRGDLRTHVPTIRIGKLAVPESQLHITTTWYKEQLSDQNQRAWRKVTSETAQDAVDLLPGLEIKLGDTALISYPLPALFRIRSMLATQRLPNIPCAFVPANGLTSSDIARLWDDIALKPEEEEILNGLHLIAPNVERVNLLGHSDMKSGRVPMVRVKGVLEPLPLRSIGEGMNRIFGIVLALVNAKNGLLLIDEVDSGLHYTVHPSLWRLIFQVAARLNIQVFATTHSWDCIEGFQQVAQEMAGKTAMLIRLEQRKGHIVPILFDEDRLGIATRQDIEVR
jgi:hypothetical protein